MVSPCGGGVDLHEPVDVPSLIRPSLDPLQHNAWQTHLRAGMPTSRFLIEGAAELETRTRIHFSHTMSK